MSILLIRYLHRSHILNDFIRIAFFIEDDLPEEATEFRLKTSRREYGTDEQRAAPCMSRLGAEKDEKDTREGGLFQVPTRVRDANALGLSVE
jgi:hypothetical protein